MDTDSLFTLGKYRCRITHRSSGRDGRGKPSAALLEEVVSALLPLLSLLTLPPAQHPAKSQLLAGVGTSVPESPWGDAAHRHVEGIPKYLAKWVRSEEVLQKQIVCEGNSCKSLGRRETLTDAIFCL